MYVELEHVIGRENEYIDQLNMMNAMMQYIKESNGSGHYQTVAYV